MLHKTKYEVTCRDKGPSIVVILCNHWPNFYGNQMSKDRWVLWEMIYRKDYNSCRSHLACGISEDPDDLAMGYHSVLVRCINSILPENIFTNYPSIYAGKEATVALYKQAEKSQEEKLCKKDRKMD